MRPAQPLRVHRPSSGVGVVPHSAGWGRALVLVFLVGRRAAGLLPSWFQALSAWVGVGGCSVSRARVQSMIAAWWSGPAPRWWRRVARTWALMASTGLVVRSRGV